MAKTVEQKLTEKICIMLKHSEYRRDSAQLHIVVRGSRLRFTTTKNFCTGDIYVLKVRNQHGSVTSRQAVRLRVGTLAHYIALTPLLKKQTGRM